MPSSFRDFMRLSGVFGKVTVKSALNSQVWLIAFFLIVIVALGFFQANSYILAFLCLLLLIIVLYFIRCYDYFMHKNPDYLRSETFQIQKQQIEMMGSKSKEVPAQVIDAEPVIQKPNPRKSTRHNEVKIKKGVNR